MTQWHDPDGARLPIKVDSTSNGEFVPRPLTAAQRHANRLAHERVGHDARKVGLSRRDFLITASGAATTLIAFNDAHAAAGETGGTFAIPREAGLDGDVARNAVSGDEFIFDIQGHHVSPLAKWRNSNSPWLEFSSQVPRARCSEAAPGKWGHLACLSQEVFVKDIFLDSDTQLAVLSFVPSLPDDEPLSMEEAAATRAIVESLSGSPRLLLHGRVIPTVPADLGRMDELREKWKISAWKTYTQFGSSWWLDDARTGIPFLEKVRASGLKVLCIHKGIPLAPQGTDNVEYSLSRDVGPAAKLFPDIAFLVYHSGYDPAHSEGPYTPGKAGVDSLVKTLLDSNIAPNSNVYAELGTTWRVLMSKPDQAAHVLGKLLTYVGEDNIVWGTDSIWYGSPQDQIQAFRTFQISDQLREKYGYPQITPKIRAKIFGLNAARVYGISVDEVRRRAAVDDVARIRGAYLGNPSPHFMTAGPKTRREFLRFHRLGGHS